MTTELKLRIYDCPGAMRLGQRASAKTHSRTMAAPGMIRISANHGDPPARLKISQHGMMKIARIVTHSDM